MQPAAPMRSRMPRGSASSICETAMFDADTIPSNDVLRPGPVDEAPLDAYSRVVAAIADRIGPAVVRVTSGGRGRRGGLGSGVIIAGDGLALTNSHVVAGARRVRLALPEGGETEAQVIGDDSDTDLALLRADLPRGTPAAALSDSKALRRG